MSPLTKNLNSFKFDPWNHGLFHVNFYKEMPWFLDKWITIKLTSIVVIHPQNVGVSTSISSS